MSDFKRLSIENFQSHHHTVIDFSSGLNVFVGPSDSGKSAILRALRWVLFNTPRGNEFIRSGTKECRVTLSFQDGSEVVRVRSTSVNRYIFRTTGGEEHVFEGFGNEIPKEITDAHRIQALKIDGKEMMIHLGTQLESPFLLFETAGSKAKTIGRVSGAHLIDKAFKKASTERQNANLELKRLEHEIEELTVRLEPYSNLEEIEQRVSRSEQAYTKAKELEKKVVCLYKIKENLVSIQCEKETQRKWLKNSEGIKVADTLLREIEKKTTLLNRYSILHKKNKIVREEIFLCQQKVSKGQNLYVAEEKIQLLVRKQHQLITLKKLQEKWEYIGREKRVLQGAVSKKKEWATLEPILKNVSKKVEGLRVLQRTYERYTDVCARISKGMQFKADKEKEITTLIQQYARVLKDLKQCPTCGLEIDSSVTDHIIGEYQGGDAYVAAGRERSND